MVIQMLIENTINMEFPQLKNGDILVLNIKKENMVAFS
jgi:hypothetical protein